MAELKKAFEDSIDDYLAFCEAEGVKPEKPYSGKFVLRLSLEEHKLITVAAAYSGESLNAWAAKHLVKEARIELKEVEE
ncbi:type II toxin-antitoxin system HicB family antitoxin [Salisediminibacterium beveridgei]|uniref:type II toxin-antitoxin system HicB family antitoxin n=1 Tax=Salisediminibacterium beveridgei TaxID=632773 RepID=UPI0018DDF016|nr:type II toxin-antitoxin system HicB family antitoxin [Salisediminibacterium beveridgei]